MKWQVFKGVSTGVATARARPPEVHRPRTQEMECTAAGIGEELAVETGSSPTGSRQRLDVDAAGGVRIRCQGFGSTGSCSTGGGLSVVQRNGNGK